MSILSLISSNNFIVLNKTLISLLGIEEALMLGELASEYDYWVNQGKTKDGWFFSTVENVERNTNLSKHRQKKALDNLQKKGLVTVERKGMPAKRYIRINEDAIGQILSNKKSKILTSRSEKFELQEVKKIDRNKNKDNKNKVNKNKKESKKERKEKSSDHFSQNDRVSSNTNKNEKSKSYVNNGKDAINEKNSVLSENKSNSDNKKAPRINEKLEFEKLWTLYPRKQGKKAAYAAFTRARKSGVALDTISSGIKAYVHYIDSKKISQEYIKQGSTFFNQHSWDDDWTVTDKKANYDIEAYERINRELFEAYPSGGNERRSELDQFMNPKFNKNIIDLEEEND